MFCCMKLGMSFDMDKLVQEFRGGGYLLPVLFTYNIVT
jgi:hypothetical protein